MRRPLEGLKKPDDVFAVITAGGTEFIQERCLYLSGGNTVSLENNNQTFPF